MTRPQFALRAVRRTLRPAFAAAALFALSLPAAQASPPPASTSQDWQHRDALLDAAPSLNPAVLDLALEAVQWASINGTARRTDLLTVIDYSLPSTEPRLWVLDLERERLLFHELVAHGVGSGDNLPTRFSNVDGSRQSSLGLFKTGATYEGGNGYSLKLHGLEAGTNDHALERTIVMHGAWYVSEQQIENYGRLGRSWGCPALSIERARPVIDAIRGGTLLFSYYPQSTWLARAAYGGGARAKANATLASRTAAK